MILAIPILTLGGLGLLFGIWLSFAHKLFGIKEDPRIEQILFALPGSNCGACGLGGCHAYAESIAAGKTNLGLCAPGGEDTYKKIAEIMGKKPVQRIKQTATLVCGGGAHCKNKFDYDGPLTCASCNMLFGGNKSCAYACLGLGDCLRVCPFDAIVMAEGGLPKIDMEKCTACKKCIKACPKDVICLTPVDKSYYINCSSKDKGAVVAKICKVGCIGCGKCVKECPVNAITLKDGLAIIDYEKCTDCGRCLEVCPTKTIVKR